jgi:zinc-finger of a C2HC-type
MNADALLELQNAAAMAAFTTAVMDACPHCGRTFIADRLKIHLRRYAEVCVFSQYCLSSSSVIMLGCVHSLALDTYL